MNSILYVHLHKAIFHFPICHFKILYIHQIKITTDSWNLSPYEYVCENIHNISQYFHFYKNVSRCAYFECSQQINHKISILQLQMWLIVLLKKHTHLLHAYRIPKQRLFSPTGPLNALSFQESPDWNWILNFNHIPYSHHV